MRKTLLLCLLVISGLSCATQERIPQTVSNSEYCSAADMNLQKLACIPVGKPYTDKGKSFTEFCQETQSAGIPIHPDCLATITSCGQVNSCSTTGVK